MDGELSPGVVVFGQAGRDLVLPIDELPQPGAPAVVHTHREVLGGKGANQAVSFARLGIPVALVAVLGDDRAGDEALAQARADGIDVSYVVRRSDTVTGLIVEVLDREHRWRYFEDLPEAVQLTPVDVEAAGESLAWPRHRIVSRFSTEGTGRSRHGPLYEQARPPAGRGDEEAARTVRAFGRTERRRSVES